MRLTKKLIAGVCVVVVLDIIFLWYVFTAPIEQSNYQEIEFTIAKGQSTHEIALQLHRQNLIRSPILFRAYAFVTGTYKNLQAGDYVLRPSMTMQEITRRFASGNFVDSQLRVLEGWSLQNIAENLEQQELFSQDAFYTVVGIPGIDYRTDKSAPRPKDFSKEFTFLQEKPDYVSLEGYLFPDTYHVAKGDSAEDVVRRALKNFDEKITPEIRAEAATQGKSLFEIITMASIIEKEVRSLEDKKLVSGILWKRLAGHMRLEVDSTIVYVREGNYYRVTFEELEVDSSYNTYRNYGLPPGPISNPGLESIEAALYPTESPYWFYLSPNINTTVFSETFDQHRAAADLYIR